MDYNTLNELTESQILSMSDNEIRELKPKRKRSAWIYFSIDKRPEVRQQFPGYRMSYITKELGKIWKVMNDAEKQPYTDMSEEDAERRNTEMEMYNVFLELHDIVTTQ